MCGYACLAAAIAFATLVRMYDAHVESELTLLRHRLKVALRRLETRDLEVRPAPVLRGCSHSGLRTVPSASVAAEQWPTWLSLILN